MGFKKLYFSLFLNEIMHCSSISWKCRSPLSERRETHYPPSCALFAKSQSPLLWQTMHKVTVQTDLPRCLEKLQAMIYFTLKSEPVWTIYYMAILLMRYLRGILEHQDLSKKSLSKGIYLKYLWFSWHVQRYDFRFIYLSILHAYYRKSWWAKL